MNFKLKFHTSATTNLEPYEIIANIQFELRDKKYIGKYVTDRSVSFTNDFSGFRSSWSPAMLDKGEFIISDEPDGVRLVTLNYDWSFLPFLIIITAVIILSVSLDDYTPIMFFGSFVAIITPIDLMSHKGKASELIAAVTQG